MEESERIFSKLIRSIEKQSCEVKELIRVQERATVSQAEELLEKIQREIVELRRAEAELEKLSRTEDHVHFLQVCNKGEPQPVMLSPKNMLLSPQALVIAEAFSLQINCRFNQN